MVSNPPSHFLVPAWLGLGIGCSGDDRAKLGLGRESSRWAHGVSGVSTQLEGYISPCLSLLFSPPLNNFPIGPPFRSFPHLRGPSHHRSLNPSSPPPPAPTWPSTTYSAAGSPAGPRSAASSSPPRYWFLPIVLAVILVLQSSFSCPFLPRRRRRSEGVR